MWQIALLVLIVANLSLLVNIARLRESWIRIVLYDTLAIAIFTILTLYQSDKGNNFITTNTGRLYTLNKFAPNTNLYIDRGYRLLKVPKELSGTTLIQTANDDKKTNQENLFSFTVDKGIGAKVYFIFDGRINGAKRPWWLHQVKLEKLTDSLTSTDKDARYLIYSHTIQGDHETIHFGGNNPYVNDRHNKGFGARYSMYMVAVQGVDAQQIITTNDAKDINSLSITLVDGPDSVLLTKRLAMHQNWLVKENDNSLDRFDFSTFPIKKLKSTLFYNANLRRCDISGVDSISGSAFNSSNLKEGEFSRSGFYDVNFYNSYLGGANFNNATLKNCSFAGSDLRGAIFTNVKFRNVDLYSANLAGVVFEPDSIPNIQSIAFAYNLDSLTYRTNPGALIKLKERLKSAGFSGAAAKVTAAIQRRKHQLDTNWVSSTIDYLLFDITCAYGLSPIQPLILLLVLIYAFYRIYLFLFFSNMLEVEIEHEAETEKGEFATVKDTLHPGRLLFLSLITSFSIGFGPYNINDWAKKLLKEEYTIRQRGYTRILIGIQNLMSLYLFSLTALVLLGDLFN